MKKLLFFLISGMLFICVPLQGQILDKMIKKTQKKYEKKSKDAVKEKEEEVEEEVDEEIDETTDKAEKRFLEGLMGGEKAEVADTYSFDGVLEMTFISYENDQKKSEGRMRSYISNQGNQFAYQWTGGDLKNQDQKGIVIYDIKRSAMIILGEDNQKKSGMVYGMDMEDLREEMMNEEDVPEETWETNPYLKKTGKIKIINGYKCYEYVAKDSAIVAHYWMAKDVKGDYARFMKKVNPAFSYHYAAWRGGFLMEAEIEDLAENKRDIMQVSDLDLNKKTEFNLNEYSLINLGTMKTKTNSNP